ncbi:polysaccharide deacetylase [Nitratireductor aestuarii]|uniref:Polysaccharide deacetylase n=1 Tax=Nitratireductor aestuarii TaxID=1735103 RepID=A0A916W6J8_9HYPH|nr:polysaccharide deacetylase [Nitratireductor aestuarii]GGA72273.1 polysaccharide deacetylase [Nitratireductor aestuarii]
MSAKHIGLVAFSALLTLSPAHARERPPQYVLISFDGAGPVAQWKRSRELATQVGAEFTYFLSCVYLLTRENRSTYVAPGANGPKSNVGYASSREDVAARLDQIWKARAEGHEIANHGCGHLDGAHWSVADWQHEFKQFDKVLLNAWKLNDIAGEPADWAKFAREEVKGFRAPYLSTSSTLFKALDATSFLYDGSTVSNGPVAVKVKDGVYRFSLPMIPEGPRQRPIIAMDYNLYFRHSGAQEEPERGAEFEQRAYEAFMAAFTRQYDNGRTPLQIGLHFTLMNGGAYWRALERFAREVCPRKDVRCVSNQRYLDETESKQAHLPGRTDG